MPRKMPFPTALSDFSAFPSPSDFESNALTPTPVPTPTAIMSNCTGKANVRARLPSTPFSPMFIRKAVSTIL